MSLEGLNGTLDSFLREDAVAPEDSVKPELGEDGTTTPGELQVTTVKEEQVEKEEVKEEDVDPTLLSSPRELTTLDYKYGVDRLTKLTQPKKPHSTRFPDFPHIPNRIAPHPLDRSSWFNPELSFPPPAHLHTFDNGKSLFDVDFSRQPSSDIGGSTIAMITAANVRNVCCSSWHAPQDHVGDQGGPYYVLSSDHWSDDWEQIDTIRAQGESHAVAVAEWEKQSEEEKKGKSRPEGHDGSVSLFYGGRAHTWRYRGDVKVHKQVDILPEHFAQMGEEERSQWINYFRFENVTRRLRGRLPGSDPEKSWIGQTPNQFFEYLSNPESKKLVLTILKVVGYNQERIEGWLEKRRERLAPSLERSVAPTPAVEEKKPKKRKTREESTGSSAPEVEEEKPFVRVTRSKSDKKPKIEAIRRKSSKFTPFVAVPKRRTSKLVKREP